MFLFLVVRKGDMSMFPFFSLKSFHLYVGKVIIIIISSLFGLDIILKIHIVEIYPKKGIFIYNAF